MAVISDIIDGRLSKGVDGLRATRTFVVTDVTGTASARPFTALATSGVPAYGDAHPADSSIVVTDLDVTPVSGDPAIFNVEATYGPAPTSDPRNSPPGTVLARRIRPSGDTERTVFDKDGVLMDVAYIGLNLDAFTLTQVAFEVEIPGRGYAFEVEQVLADGAVSATLDIYRGAVNVLPWNGKAARTWLCSDPSAEPIDGTSNYLVTWTFLYRAKTWDHVERIRLGGHIPSDYAAGGEGTFRVIRELDFSPLNAFTVP